MRYKQQLDDTFNNNNNKSSIQDFLNMAPQKWVRYNAELYHIKNITGIYLREILLNFQKKREVLY